MSAGELREKLAFDEVASSETTYGVTPGDWDEQFVRSARVQPRFGSEPVIAQRLAGVQPVTIKVRADTDTRRITNAWRARNTRSGVVYQIRTVTPDEKGAYIEILAEAGVAV